MMTACYSSGMETLPSTRPTCDGTVIIPTADGPDVSACTKRGCTCKARRAVAERIARTGDPFLGAATAADEEW